MINSIIMARQNPIMFDFKSTGDTTLRSPSLRQYKVCVYASESRITSVAASDDTTEIINSTFSNLPLLHIPSTHTNYKPFCQIEVWTIWFLNKRVYVYIEIHVYLNRASLFHNTWVGLGCKVRAVSWRTECRRIEPQQWQCQSSICSGLLLTEYSTAGGSSMWAPIVGDCLLC
jgi:hypothetical protein